MDMYFCTTLKQIKKRQKLVTFFTWQHSSSVLALKRCKAWVPQLPTTCQWLWNSALDVFCASPAHQCPPFSRSLPSHSHFFYCISAQSFWILLYICTTAPRSRQGRAELLKALKHMVSWNEDCAVWVMCRGFGL